MSLRVLVTCPASPKLFADLAASGCFVRSHHPELELEILVEKNCIPRWWQKPGEWMQIRSGIAECTSHYDLVIQTTPELDLARDLLAVDAENRSGVVLAPDLYIQGRWAQTLIAQLGCQHFAPFTPFDLFNHVLLGRTAMNFSTPLKPVQGYWVVDLDSMSEPNKAWAEQIIAQLSLSHPGKVLDRLNTQTTPQNVAYYIGADAAAASWFSYFGTQVVFFHPQPWSAFYAPANPDAWVVPLTSLPTLQQLVGTLTQGQDRFSEALKHTTEFLGGQLLESGGEKLADPTQVLERLHYIVFNYLNDLMEVDLPVPEVNAACCMRLKVIQNVLGKLVHLNQFGIKFIQEFLDKEAKGNLTQTDLEEIKQKITEIDDYTEKTLAVYPEMELLKLWVKFTKAGAQGTHMVEVAKSMILVLHEANQALEAYRELMETIIKKHTSRQDVSGEKESP